MKPIIIIILVIVIIGAVVGIGIYGKSINVTDLIPVTQSLTDQPAVITPATSPVPVITAPLAPLPTVAQITLNITSPADGSTVSTPSVIVRGITVPKAEVFVNDFQVTANTAGNFSVPVTLDDGDNSIVVTANDSSGNYAEQELTVTYNSGQ